MGDVVTMLSAEDINFDRAPAEGEPNHRFPDSWRFLDDVQLLELPDPEYLIQGVLQRRGVGVIYAPSGAGKTTLVAGQAIALATGHDWFGHPVLRRGATMYVATEDPSGFKVRLRSAKRAARLPLDRAVGVYTFPEPIDLRDPVSVGRFGQFLQQADLLLPLENIVVDTYSAATPGANENSHEDTSIAMGHAHHWRDRLGVTVTIVHHTNAGGSRERGHSAMRGASDFMIAMNPTDDVIAVEISKNRNGPTGETFNLRLVPTPDKDGCVLRLASDVLSSSTLTPAQAKVYATLRDNFAADGATKSQWQGTCPDVSERTFHRACKALVERGYAQAVGSHFRITGKAVA